eukprot:3887815-Pyramimonas_sp.AAC.1
MHHTRAQALHIERRSSASREGGLYGHIAYVGVVEEDALVGRQVCYTIPPGGFGGPEPEK